MENIFNNNKLKKLISTIILVMIGMNFIAPSVTVINNSVYATSNSTVAHKLMKEEHVRLGTGAKKEKSESEYKEFYTVLEEKIMDFLDDESGLDYEAIDVEKFVDIFLKAKLNGTNIEYNSNSEVVEGRDVWYNSDNENVWFLISNTSFLQYAFEYFLKNYCHEDPSDARVLAGNLFGSSSKPDYYGIYSTASMTSFTEGIGQDTGSIDEETRIKEKIRQWIEDNTSYGYDNAYTETGWNTLIGWIYNGEEGCSYQVDSDGNVTNVVISERALSNLSEMDGMLNEGSQSAQDGDVPDGTSGADIGGILLSPVFYLINFISDAITSNVGNIMTGQGLSVVSGTKLLQSNKDAMSDLSSTGEVDIDVSSFLLGGIQYPDIRYTPEEIFAGKIDLLSIDFISGKNFKGEDNENEGWNQVRFVIGEWYKVLRMVAIIGLLSVLIYTGIKIMISSNAKDKAKYKEWIINWFVAVAILFFMHYIMSFIISVIGQINKLLANACGGITVNLSNGESFVTNLMGLVRFMIQSEDFYIKVGYEVMYIALIVYTVKFTVIYLKRVLNMAFLTLIAPIVALTYPIDKMNDGQAQGFNMWLKEYIFNALLQPMHYIMYYVLVGAAIDIAANNPIYAIVVLMFMTEAERLLKKIFGFDKAGGGTVGGMTGAFAAGALASNIKNIARMSKLPGGNGNKNGSGGADGNALPDGVKPEKDNYLNDLLNEGGSEQDYNSQGQGAPNGSEENQQGNSQPEENQQNSNEQGDTNEPENGQQEQQGAEQQGTEQQGEKQPNTSGDDHKPIRQKAKGNAVKKGLANVGKTVARPIWDFNRDPKDNGQRWKRRGVSALKGAGRFAVGATLGTAAAAVQAGISITDGKYNPMEGFATFAAGYAGAGKLTKGIGGSISNSFKEGYYSENQESARERQKKEFLYNDDVHRAYMKKYENKEEAEKMKNLAAQELVTYGYTDTKQQFEIEKFAKTLNSNGDVSKDDIVRARRTYQFMEGLENQGVGKGIIKDPAQQKKYIQSVLNSKNYSEKDKERVTRVLENEFRLAGQYQQMK